MGLRGSTACLAIAPSSVLKRRLRLWLDLEWIFERLAHDQSFAVFAPESHPVRTGTLGFLAPHLKPTDRVLDLGCNTGELVDLLAREVAEVVGIELDAGVAIARERHRRENVTLGQGDAIEYSLCHPPCDIVVLWHLIEHFDDPRPLLRTVARHVSPVSIEMPDYERSLSIAVWPWPAPTSPTATQTTLRVQSHRAARDGSGPRLPRRKMRKRRRA